MNFWRFIFSILAFFFFQESLSAAQYVDPARHFSFEYDGTGWEIVPAAKKVPQDVDKAMSERTLVTIQRKAADDKYHARFSVVIDDMKTLNTSRLDPLLAYQKHAVDFMKSQRFSIVSTSPKTLPKVPLPSFEIIARQRDFGLTFKQVVFVSKNDAFLLTAATRTVKFESDEKEMQKFFDSFQFQLPSNNK